MSGFFSLFSQTNLRGNFLFGPLVNSFSERINEVSGSIAHFGLKFYELAEIMNDPETKARGRAFLCAIEEVRGQSGLEDASAVESDIFMGIFEAALIRERENPSDVYERFAKEHYKDNPKAGALASLVPDTHVKPNNKLSREMTREFLNKGNFELRVSKLGVKKEITMRAMLSYPGKNITLSDPTDFTPYDREVHDGVVTLYEAGNEVITPAMVYRAMNGMSETEKISPQAVETVSLRIRADDGADNKRSH